MNAIDEILAERGSRYGKFIDHASIAQQLKGVMRAFWRERRQRESVSDLAADQREALDMIAHKLGRILNGDPDYADSWDDIAGYAKLVGDRLRGAVK